MKPLPIDVATWAIDWDCVIDKSNNKPFKWIVDKQIVPMDFRLKKIFNNGEYSNHVKKLIKNYNYEFNEKLFNQRKLKKSKMNMENVI